MYTHTGFMAGANLGHWISQYGDKSHGHFSSYIRESDIERAASWGLDHLRLPVDYFLFENDSLPGVFDEDGLKYIDDCISWCKKYGLNTVLDLHHAPGYFFGNGDRNLLFTDSGMQKRFLDIWQFFALRYMSEGENLVFELLNELVQKNSDSWNILWQKAAELIHEIDPDRRIIVGGNRWNSVDELKNLAVSDNQNIWYTFHMYHPMVFTHQAASWDEAGRRYNKVVTYPVDSDLHSAYYFKERPPLEHGILGIDYLDQVLAPAYEFIDKYKKPLYCGEYGVIRNAPVDSAVRWINDLSSLLISHGIGRAVWSLRGFSLVTDEDNNVVSDEYIKAISRKQI